MRQVGAFAPPFSGAARPSPPPSHLGRTEKGPHVSVDFLKMSTVEKAVTSYLGELEEADATRLQFFKGLWDIQDSLTAGAAAYAVPSGEEATAAARNREPLFARFTPEVDRDAYLGAVAKIAEYVRENAGLSDDQVAALAGADFDAAVTAEALAKAPYAVDEFLAEVYEGLLPEDDDVEDAADSDADDEAILAPAVFAMVAVAALTPLVAGAAIDARRAIDTKTLSELAPQECPVCGSMAAMSFVGERSSLQGGDRKLWCGMCHTTWPYGRLRCARCGTRSSTVLRYKHTEEDPGHRIHICDDCHGYIRTVFHDEVTHIVSPVVEDVVTSHLHIVAEDLGYTAAGDGIKRADVAEGVEYPEDVNLDGTF